MGNRTPYFRSTDLSLPDKKLRIDRRHMQVAKWRFDEVLTCISVKSCHRKEILFLIHFGTDVATKLIPPRLLVLVAVGHAQQGKSAASGDCLGAFLRALFCAKTLTQFLVSS